MVNNSIIIIIIIIIIIYSLLLLLLLCQKSPTDQLIYIYKSLNGAKIFNALERRGRVVPSDAKKCQLLSMGALSTITYKNYTIHISLTLNTNNNINGKLCTNKRFKSYVNTKYH